jgi:hypothetical protein
MLSNEEYRKHQEVANENKYISVVEVGIMLHDTLITIYRS